jgi:hypothetical protein
MRCFQRNSSKIGHTRLTEKIIQPYMGVRPPRISGKISTPYFLGQKGQEPNLVVRSVRQTTAPCLFSSSALASRSPSPLLQLGPRLAIRCVAARPPLSPLPLLSVLPIGAQAELQKQPLLIYSGSAATAPPAPVSAFARYSRQPPLPPLDSGPLQVCSWSAQFLKNLALFCV